MYACKSTGILIVLCANKETAAATGMHVLVHHVSQSSLEFSHLSPSTWLPYIFKDTDHLSHAYLTLSLNSKERTKNAFSETWQCKSFVHKLSFHWLFLLTVDNTAYCRWEFVKQWSVWKILSCKRVQNWTRELYLSSTWHCKRAIKFHLIPLHLCLSVDFLFSGTNKE